MALGRIVHPLSVLVTLAVLPGCDWMRKKDPPNQKARAEQLAAAQDEQIRKACASPATYDRLKELAFDEAVRIRKADPRQLDPLAASSVVRMEKPVVKSRDEELNVTVCSGRFILELPPGAENAFDGERRLIADIEYAAQAAADGSGLVYQMDGAEPIIYRLATFSMNGMPRFARAAPAQTPAPESMPLADSYQAPPGAPASAAPAAPAPAPRAAPVPRPAPRPAPVPSARPASAPVARPAPAPAQAQPVRNAGRPSFNCRSARTRSEKMVCGSSSLAARDRSMSSLYYSAIASADPATKSRIRASRDRFLARRERCSTEACVAQAYQDRVAEIRRMSSGGE